MKIQSIVEGHGEVEAVPVLIRRLLNECGIHDIMVSPAFRGKQSKLLTEDGLQQTIKLARLDPECAGIIVLFENEDGCPKTLGRCPFAKPQGTVHSLHGTPAIILCGHFGICQTL